MKLKISKEIIISNSSRTLLVAEISANHCGNKKIFEHIIKAKKFGADLVKIQTYEENDISTNLRDLKKL